jgi:hypothetical protein
MTCLLLLCLLVFFFLSTHFSSSFLSSSFLVLAPFLFLQNLLCVLLSVEEREKREANRALRWLEKSRTNRSRCTLPSWFSRLSCHTALGSIIDVVTVVALPEEKARKERAKEKKNLREQPKEKKPVNSPYPLFLIISYSSRER